MSENRPKQALQSAVVAIIMAALMAMCVGCRDSQEPSGTVEVSVETVDGYYTIEIVTSRPLDYAILRQWEGTFEHEYYVWPGRPIEGWAYIGRLRTQIHSSPIWGYIYDVDGNEFYWRSDNE